MQLGKFLLQKRKETRAKITTETLREMKNDTIYME